REGPSTAPGTRGRTAGPASGNPPASTRRSATTASAWDWGSRHTGSSSRPCRAEVAYHVQIRRSFRRALLFNLCEERLGEEILDPWIADCELEIGGQRWEPRDSDLRIIEGP